MPIDVPGLVSATDLHATVDGIVEWQLPSGMIPWFPGGHADPWNHVEAAMALDLGGRRAEADRAYQWLVDLQRDDGSWHQYYIAGDDGSTQVTYDGRPLYYYVDDPRGQILCHGVEEFGGVWLAVQPDGAAVQ